MVAQMVPQLGAKVVSIAQITTVQRYNTIQFSKMAERVGFEPTLLAPIRFRGGAVMTASVPLLIRRRSFYQQSAIIRKG